MKYEHVQQYRCQQQHTWTATINDTVHHEIATLRCTSGRKRAHLPSFTREIPSARSGQLRIKRRIHWLIGVNTGVTTRYYNAVLTPINQCIRSFTDHHNDSQLPSTVISGVGRRREGVGGQPRINILLPLINLITAGTWPPTWWTGWNCPSHFCHRVFLGFMQIQVFFGGGEGAGFEV